MLRALIISPDTELSHRLKEVLDTTGLAVAVRQADEYPDEVQLSRMIRAQGPQVVFLSIQSLEYCAAATAHIESIMPGLQVVAVGRHCDAEVLMGVMRAGVREFLAFPFESSTVRACLERVHSNLRTRPVSMPLTDAVFSFLPSKPGVGTSTLAMNLSVALAATDTPTLLSDFDLNSGLLRFMTKATSEYSILDALQNAATMDEQLWAQIVNRRHGVDVLHAGRINPDLRIEKMQVQHLLEYVRRNYGAICVDLSGNLEKYSLELMHESKKIFVVCTPELASLHLAREKTQYLHHLDLADRAVILLNRQGKRGGMEIAEIEKLVSIPVEAVFPNDYVGVNRALANGDPAARGSEFMRQCTVLAQKLLAKKVEPVTEKRRFIEYFSVMPARFSFEGRKSS
jgi:pilus assembly protein CpaE